METRQILQIVLAVIILSIVGLGIFIFLSFGTKAQATVVKEVIVDNSAPPEVNPYEKQGPTAVELVKVRTARVPATLSEDEKKAAKKNRGNQKEGEEEGPTETIPIATLLERDDFIKNTLKLDNYEKLGWKVQWWGETEFGEWFYLVTYAFKDAHITVGPSWLVDLKQAKVVPKNVLARVVMNPRQAVSDDYYDKHKQVVSALASHRFESGLTLSGALLLHFENREESSEGDSILGWTIEHDRGTLFRAYFQWVEAGEPTYAEFEFDYEAKALKASNLQAADVMRIGEDFAKTERADIMPESYDPSAQRGKNWTGRAKKACSSRKMRDQCQSMSTMFEQREIVEALEWLLTAQAQNSESFKACKESRQCKWSSKPKDGAENVYVVSYIYNLGEDGNKDGEDDGSATKGERTVAWEVALKDEKITPVDRISQAAWLAIHPRGN